MTREKDDLVRRNYRDAKLRWGSRVVGLVRRALEEHSRGFRFSVASGDLILLGGTWYITNSGLMRLARRNRCPGIQVELVSELCDPSSSRFAFRAIVYTSQSSKGFLAYGDADPSNVSPLVHGAEMRVAETRAVNRALRKAYGIGMCSIEEIGSNIPDSMSEQARRQTTGSITGTRTNVDKSESPPRVRDRLCQIIRRHELNAELVKAYATNFCGVKTLREASREQVENFVAHLAGWAEKDRNALLCQLNSYGRRQERAA